jgi:hypothetical protein
MQAIVQAVNAVQHPPPTKGDGENRGAGEIDSLRRKLLLILHK